MTVSEAKKIIMRYEQAKAIRSPLEADWRMASAYTRPSQYSAWAGKGPSHLVGQQGASRRVAFDSTGPRSLPKYQAILERMVSPYGTRWHTLTPSNEHLRKQRRVKMYFDELTSLLFRMRYHPRANFRSATSEMYAQIGTYGNGPVFVGKRRLSPAAKDPGFLYKSISMRDYFVERDDEGNMRASFRRMWLNVHDVAAKFRGTEMPPRVAAEASKPSPDANKFFEFVHFVEVREEGHDPNALGNERHPYRGEFICVDDAVRVGDEHGYADNPYLMPRATPDSDGPYGYSPAVSVLSSLGGASAMKKTNLKQGQQAVQPTLLAHDDGVANGTVDLRPGAINYGAVNQDGRPMVHTLPAGNYQIGKDLLQDERRDIEDAFFVTLFQILTETPEMTATEVMERVAEKTALLAPTMGSMQSEWAGPMIGREIGLLAEMGKLPEMPPELVEAEGEYDVVYTSPMAKGMYAEEVSGLMRSVEMATQVATVKGEPSALDHFDFDAAIPEVADYMAVPTRWMKDEAAVKQERDNRSAQAQEAQLMNNAGPLAQAAKTAEELGA